MKSTLPPMLPWQKGSHEDHAVLTVEVDVCRDLIGRVFSMHRLQGEDDASVASTWPGGGHEAVGFALLTEAIRREAMLEVLILASQNGSHIRRIMALPEEERRLEFDKMGAGLTGVLLKIIGQIAPNAIEEAVLQLAESGKH